MQVRIFVTIQHLSVGIMYWIDPYTVLHSPDIPTATWNSWCLLNHTPGLMSGAISQNCVQCLYNAVIPTVTFEYYHLVEFFLIS